MLEVMQTLFTRPWLKSFSGLAINLSGAWFSVAIVSPNFLKMELLDLILFLTQTIGSGIVFLVLSVYLETLLEYD